MHNLNDQLAAALQEVQLLKRRIGGRVTTIGKYSFGFLKEGSSWRKRDISDYNFGILVDMKSMLEFFPIGPTYYISKMLKNCVWFRQEYLIAWEMQRLLHQFSTYWLQDLVVIWHQS